MNYKERNDLYITEDFIGRVRMALCDWLNYWAINGTFEIEDETTKQLTDNFITAAIFNLESIVRRVAVLVIAESSVKNAIEVSDANIQIAVVNILSHSLNYLI